MRNTEIEKLSYQSQKGDVTTKFYLNFQNLKNTNKNRKWVGEFSITPCGSILMVKRYKSPKDEDDASKDGDEVLKDGDDVPQDEGKAPQDKYETLKNSLFEGVLSRG